MFPYSPEGISILKPIKNLKPVEIAAIESFFQLEYGNFELIFSFASNEEASINLIRSLQAKYPLVQTQIIIEKHEDIENPKVNNLQTPYLKAKNDLILISDSNIRVTKDYLKKSASLMQKNIGMVTAVIAGRNPQSFFGYVEINSLNTFSARWMLIAKKMGAPVVMGKSMLFRKTDFDRFGGVKTLGCYIAEDYMAGQAMKYLGKEIAVLPMPLEQVLDGFDAKAFFNRQVRWGRLRKSQAPLAFFFEPLTTGFVSALILAASFPEKAGLLFSAHMIIWFFLDMYQLSMMGNEFRFKTALGWAFRELSYLPTWAYTLSGQTVDWKGKQIQLEPGGVIRA